MVNHKSPKPTKVVIAGLGAHGRRHLRVIQSSGIFDVVGVCDQDQAARQLATALSIPAYSKWQDLLEVDAEAAVVVLPAPLHYRSSKAFLERGFDVLSEKPITMFASDARRLQHLARQKNRVLMVGHIERFNPGLLKLKEIVDSRILGRIESIRAQRLSRSQRAQHDCDVVRDLAIHDIDAVAHLLGDRPKLEQVDFDPEHPQDSVQIQMRQGSIEVSIVASRRSEEPARSLEVTGSSGIATLDYSQQSVSVRPVHEFKPSYSFKGEVNQLAAELFHFRDCVKTRTEARNSTHDAICALQEAERIASVITDIGLTHE